MPTLALTAGQISQIVEVGPGTRITSSGNGNIEWVAGALADAKNGSGTWANWPKGSSAGNVDTVRRMCIRATATGAMTVTLDESKHDDMPDGAYWDSQVVTTQTNATTGATEILDAAGGVIPIFGQRTLTVGPSGQYKTIADAITAATDLTPTAASRVVIVLQTGTHSVTTQLTLPPYISIYGMLDRDSTIVEVTGTGLVPFKYTTNNSFGNLTIRYSATGIGTAYALQDSANGSSENTVLELNNVRIEFLVVSTYQGGCLRLNGNRYVRLNDCELATTKWGVSSDNANTIHLNNCDIWLLNANTNTSHIGLRVPSATRVQMRGGKIATGYGQYTTWPANEGIEYEVDQHIYGVLAAAGAPDVGRIELYNVWCIVRNQSGAQAGIDTIPVCNQGATVIRIFGGYYQAEDGGASAGDKFDLSNESTGIIQTIGNVACTSVFGPVTGMSGSPGSVRTIATDTAIVDAFNECSGIYLVDTSAGSVTITLPGAGIAAWNSRVTIKRISAANVATIVVASSGTIDGAASLVLPATAYAGATLVYTGSGWLIE